MQATSQARALGTSLSSHLAAWVASSCRATNTRVISWSVPDPDSMATLGMTGRSVKAQPAPGEISSILY